jgi:hypothetical protein
MYLLCQNCGFGAVLAELSMPKEQFVHKLAIRLVPKLGLGMLRSQ